MIYKASEVIWIFGAGLTNGRTKVRGPRGPKNVSAQHTIHEGAAFTFLVQNVYFNWEKHSCTTIYDFFIRWKG